MHHIVSFYVRKHLIKARSITLFKNRSHYTYITWHQIQWYISSYYDTCAAICHITICQHRWIVLYNHYLYTQHITTNIVLATQQAIYASVKFHYNKIHMVHTGTSIPLYQLHLTSPKRFVGTSILPTQPDYYLDNKAQITPHVTSYIHTYIEVKYFLTQNACENNLDNF